MRTRQKERGAIFVEAAVVFPVMLLVIFLMIYAGNAYFQKARVERLVASAVSDGAAYCADPMLKSAQSGSFPSVADLDVQPYRALLSGGAKQTADQIAGQLKKDIEGLGTGYFGGMQPNVKEVTAEYNNHFIYATFEVTVRYEIELPIRMLGDTENVKMTFSTHRSSPVTDTVELIRNVNMIEDYMEQIGLDKKIDALMEKIKTATDALTKWK